jgi:aspartyl-tRNA(Asn)/glutamyl-tRNA(Gln) amidotransferase subunit C
MQAVDTPASSRWPTPRISASACAPTPSPRRPPREAFQAVAPETEAGLYLVPKVIE